MRTLLYIPCVPTDFNKLYVEYRNEITELREID